jgi:hypothetical protein
MAMVIFVDARDAAFAQQQVRSMLGDIHKRPEFKFNKCRSDVRDAFFQRVSTCNFTVRAIVVRKSLIWSEQLRNDDASFYRFFCNSMVRFDNRVLRNARVILDGSGDAQFRRSLKSYIRNHAVDGAIRDIKVRASEAEPLLQLADMCVGAIARSYRNDRDEPNRWRNMLAKKIDDVWEFR